MRRARELTTEPTTLENIDANIGYSQQSTVRSRVDELCRTGRVDRAADALRLWRLRTSDPETRRMLSQVLDDSRALHAPITHAPGQGAFFIGVHIYGRRAPDDRTWIQTQYLTFLNIPLVPLGSYVSDGQYAYTRVPLGNAARWVRRISPIVLAWIVFGPALARGVGGLLALLIIVLGIALVQVAMIAPLWVQVGRWRQAPAASAEVGD